MEKPEFKKRLLEIQNVLGKTTLVAVTKYSPVEDMLMAYEAGLYDFGENKVQDLATKSQSFVEKGLSDVRWHFIGHLQTNKVRDLFKIKALTAIHSVDSLKLLQELYKKEHELDSKSLSFFLQMNTSGEEEKSGFESLAELKEGIDLIMTKEGSKLKFEGLMTMGSIRAEDFEAAAHKSFSKLKLIKEGLLKDYKGLKELKLSMGMSQDYKIALSYDADYVRIGSALFQ
jgi:pyridoxal phosphate enzyme (YggS family)